MSGLMKWNVVEARLCHDAMCWCRTVLLEDEHSFCSNALDCWLQLMHQQYISVYSGIGSTKIWLYTAITDLLKWDT